MAVREIWLVRHGESEANVAAARAEADGADVIDAGHRDADVPLSPLGREQSRALGRELADRGVDDVPVRLWVSPYLRAQQTIDLALQAGGLDEPGRRVDERLRDRELGVLDLLTAQGVRNRYPDEEHRRQWLGKYYHRPSGGESWIDVMLRLRSTNPNDCSSPRTTPSSCSPWPSVSTWTNQPALMSFAADHTVANASLTRLRRDYARGVLGRRAPRRRRGHRAQRAEGRHPCLLSRSPRTPCVTGRCLSPVRASTAVARSWSSAARLGPPLAALRVGAGSVAAEVSVAVPESGVQPLDEDDAGHIAVGALTAAEDDAGSADAVLVGPGLDEPDGARDLASPTSSRHCVAAS
ncbi:histidine phosphatase family protein [Curtobacterium sp. Csp1]|uniref:histidine phosphatase family protein n=1 Tax=Curtobacterium sp. Csp1 TaxID=2495429 RepID=UPI0034A0C65F